MLCGLAALAAGAAPCGPHEERLLPDAAGRPLIAARVNAAWLTMQIDTGAETSVIGLEAAARLRLPPGRARAVEGMGGVFSAGTAAVSALEFGGLAVRGLEVPVMHLSGIPAPEGLIGADVLGRAPLLLDFAARQALVWPDLCRAWPDEAPEGATLRWRASRLRLPVVEIELDGARMAALIDTGATVSAVEARSTPARQAMALGAPVASFGAGGAMIRSQKLRFGVLRLGRTRVTAPVLRGIAMDPRLGVEAIIGVDVLARCRLWLDYRRRVAAVTGST